jgi:Ion channel
MCAVYTVPVGVLLPPMASRLRALRQWRYLYLLVALVVMLVAYPYAGSGGGLGVAAVLIPIASVFALSTGHQRYRVIPAVLGTVTLFGIFEEAAGLEIVPGLAVEVSALLLFAYTTIFVLQSVLRSVRVTGDTLCGAIAVYLMMGLTWSFAHVLLQHLRPGSYRVVAGGMRMADGKELLYFSYVTLATLGYGDVVPVTDGARSLAVLEALGGTVYMAILVARLIGLSLAHSGTPR